VTIGDKKTKNRKEKEGQLNTSNAISQATTKCKCDEISNISEFEF